METAARSVLITGGARRIGRTLCQHLAQEGWNVAIHCHRSRPAAEDLAQEIQALGQRATVVQGDLAGEPRDVARLLDEANAALGPITCLINNASLFAYDTLTTVTPEQWAAHQNANVRGPVFLAQRFVAQRPDQGEANIINILDQRVWNLTGHYHSYSASKCALWALTQIWALELAPHVRVNAVGPGPTLANTDQDPSVFERQYRKIPLQTPVDPVALAKTVSFLLSMPSITGHMIPVDGGQHLAWSFPEPPSTREDE